MPAETVSGLPDRFEGTHPDPVPDGGILTVQYSDPAKAKQTIAIEVCDGDDPTEARRLEVPLRGTGKGSTQFIIPVGWGSVVLSAADSRPHRVQIALPP